MRGGYSIAAALRNPRLNCYIQILLETKRHHFLRNACLVASLIFLLSGGRSFAQVKTITNGTYSYKSWYVARKVEIVFSDGRFVSKEPFNHDSLYSRGIFWQSGDTLFLYHVPVEDTLASLYQIEEQVPLDKSKGQAMRIRFDLYYRDSTSLPGAIATFREGEKLVFPVYIGQEGTYTLITESDAIDNVQFSFLACKPLEIQLDRFRGLESTVSVFLSRSSSYFNDEYKVDTLSIDAIEIVRSTE
jgi:hypothetical protein